MLTAHARVDHVPEECTTARIVQLTTETRIARFAVLRTNHYLAREIATEKFIDVNRELKTARFVIWITETRIAKPTVYAEPLFFALMVKIITLPLSMRSFKSMQAMKELQPKIDEIKKRHKKDPQKTNQETMNLYKTHGVNPLAGCLVMLPQMPLFFALFSVFRSTILLRDAYFIWPIVDLSRGATSLDDPYIILVLIMVVAQFLSQKLTMPSAGQQNKMMGYLMPLIMGFIFWNMSAGLVLYWAMFSIMSMLDYVLFKRPKNQHVKAVG